MWSNPKTSEEVEGDMYDFVRSHLTVDGYVYRKGTRPTDRGAFEDTVVAFLSGRDGQIQTGVVVVNVYIPFVLRGDRYKVKNVPRCTEVTRILLNMVKDNKAPDGYYLETDRTVETAEEEDCNRCTIRIKYKYNAYGSRNSLG